MKDPDTKDTHGAPGFTRGPWMLRATKGGMFDIEGADGERLIVSWLDDGPNARLIAAAPTMAEYITKRADAGDTEARAILIAAAIVLIPEVAESIEAAPTDRERALAAQAQYDRSIR